MMIIPVLVIELLAGFICFQLGLLDEYQSQFVNNLDNLKLLYDEGVNNIEYDLTGDIYYAGFEEKSGSDIIGSYYYIFKGDSINIIILSKDTAEKLSKGETVRIFGRLEERASDAEYIEKAYSDRFGNGGEAFDGFVDPIFINELHYPDVRIGIIKKSKPVVVALIIITIIYFAIGMLKPSILRGYNYKAVSSSRRRAIRILDREMSRDDVSQTGRIIETERFMIYAYISHIDIHRKGQE